MAKVRQSGIKHAISTITCMFNVSYVVLMGTLVTAREAKQTRIGVVKLHRFPSDCE